MASQDSTGPNSQSLEALAKQLADLERLAADLVRSSQRSARTRTLLALSVVVILGVSLTLFWSRGRAFLGKPEPLKNALLKSYKNNQSEFENEARTFFKHVWPTVTDSFSAQFTADMPKYMTLLGTERETLAVNLNDRLQSKVQAHYDKAIDRHREILVETFPSVKDDRDLEAMSNNFKDSFKPMIKQLYGEKLKAEFDKMFETWDTFPLDDSKRSRDELSQDLYHLLFALMQEKLAAAAEEKTDSKAPGASGS